MPPVGANRTFGFTLLEVLVALIVASIGVGVLLRGAGASLVLTQHVTHLEQAVLRARSRLVAAENGHLVPGQRSGDDGRTYRWQTNITQVAASKLSPTGDARRPAVGFASVALFRVSATIFWIEAGREKSVTLATQAMGPPAGQMP